MHGIGGNVTAELKTCTYTVNDIGEAVKTWTTAMRIKGWLDLISDNTRYLNYDRKVTEASHVFVSDFVSLPTTVTALNSKLVIRGEDYDVTSIDNPMGLDEQLEFYLKFVEA